MIAAVDRGEIDRPFYDAVLTDFDHARANLMCPEPGGSAAPANDSNEI